MSEKQEQLLRQFQLITTNELLVMSRLIGLLAEAAAREIHEKMYPGEELPVEVIHVLVERMTQLAQARVLTYTPERIEQYLTRLAQAKNQAVKAQQPVVFRMDFSL